MLRKLSISSVRDAVPLLCLGTVAATAAMGRTPLALAGGDTRIGYPEFRKQRHRRRCLWKELAPSASRLTYSLSIALLAGALSTASCADPGSLAASTPQQSGSPTLTKSFDFKDAVVDRTPEGFSTALTGGGGPVSWIIQEDATAPSGGKKILAQTSSDDTDYRFPLCIYDGLTAKDVDVSVQFKAVAGRTDRAGGLVARFKDKDNYYVVRANALEDNVRLYKVENGDRKQFAGARVKVASGQWHTLKLGLRGSHFQVSFDGKMLYESDDKTFSDAGRAGLWTKADSVTYFDNLKIDSFDAK
jgi:hypothetical protein